MNHTIATIMAKRRDEVTTDLIFSARDDTSGCCLSIELWAFLEDIFMIPNIPTKIIDVTRRAIQSALMA